MKVTREDWAPGQLRPMKRARRLAYSRLLSPEEAEVLVRGAVPREMEDHWFIFEEDGVVHLYRSWTAIEAFAIRLHRAEDGGGELVEVVVNEDFARGADSILDVFFESLSLTRTSDVDIPTHVYGLNLSGPPDGG